MRNNDEKNIISSFRGRKLGCLKYQRPKLYPLLTKSELEKLFSHLFRMLLWCSSTGWIVIRVLNSAQTDTAQSFF